MKRLTTDNPKTMVEKSHNQCYIELGEAMLRGFEEETSCRDFARRLLRIHTKADYVNANDDFFDECILDALQYGHTDIEGVIAMYYDALVSNAELREQLKKYEDADENSLLVRLPCKVGDTVYVKMQFGGYAEAEVRDYTHFISCGFCVVVTSDKFNKQNIPFSEFGKTVFLTREEAEQALKARDSK